MNRKAYTLITAAQLLLLVACNNQDDFDSETIGSADNRVCFIVDDFISEDGSRTYVSPTGQFTWVEGDTLGVFPMEGYQTAFPISEGTGTSSALFDGGLWALRPNASYAAYYPFMHPMDQVHKEAIPVSYVGQTQNGNNNTQHLGKYDYIASVMTDVNENGHINFQMKHLGALVKFNLTMPEAANYTSMTVSTSAGSFITQATYGLSSFVPSYTSVVSSQTVELALNNVSTTNADKTLTLYMFMAPGTYSQYAFTITLANATKKYIATVTGKKFEAGKAYQFTATCNEPVANHTYVDLGLPSGTLWAYTNVGANNPEDIGNYYAWAEVRNKSTYTWANYRYMTPGYSTWVGCNKYTFADGSTSGVWYNMSGSFIGDNKTTLESMDDAATVNWGNEWCMPTSTQFEELLNSDNCTWIWDTVFGVNGYRVTSKKNGESIFLPVSGYKKISELVNSTTNGCYWSSTLSSSYSDNAVYLYFYSGTKNIANASRSYGQVVRPVRK